MPEFYRRLYKVVSCVAKRLCRIFTKRFALQNIIVASSLGLGRLFEQSIDLLPEWRDHYLEKGLYVYLCIKAVARYFA